jgi:hypothetical protein
MYRCAPLAAFHGTFAPVLWNTTWGRPGFDSGYVVRASMQSGGERLFKTILKP